jgi:hypothetical protein
MGEEPGLVSQGEVAGGWTKLRNILHNLYTSTNIILLIKCIFEDIIKVNLQ